MVNTYYQKHKEKLRKGARERISKSFWRRKKGEKSLKTDIKIFLKKKNKTGVSIILKVIKIFLRNKSKSKLST